MFGLILFAVYRAAANNSIHTIFSHSAAPLTGLGNGQKTRPIDNETQWAAPLCIVQMGAHESCTSLAIIKYDWIELNCSAGFFLYPALLLNEEASRLIDALMSIFAELLNYHLNCFPLSSLINFQLAKAEAANNSKLQLTWQIIIERNLNRLNCQFMRPPIQLSLSLSLHSAANNNQRPIRQSGPLLLRCIVQPLNNRLGGADIFFISRLIFKINLPLICKVVVVCCCEANKHGWTSRSLISTS